MPKQVLINKGLLVVLLAATALAGCSALGRRAPDETQVTDNPSLILPPNFDLRPPRTGGDAEAVLRRHDDTRALITGDTKAVPMAATSGTTPTGDDNWLLKRPAETSAAPEPVAPANEPAAVQERGFWQRWFGWTGL